ncbi:MAG: hypothetical protein C4576_14780 [Desulfobacteraceae bacterium]|nr:MAG: hypothetical protein C4576_14780 [Desulfobacteraceae bacterium]
MEVSPDHGVIGGFSVPYGIHLEVSARSWFLMKVLIHLNRQAHSNMLLQMAGIFSPLPLHLTSGGCEEYGH